MNRKQLWDKQKAERERARKECALKLQQLKDGSAQKEVEIEFECSNQIQNEQQMSKLDFEIKVRQELDLYKSKEKEIEDNFRTQEMLEKVKLRDDFEKRMDKYMNEEKCKQNDIIERNKIKAKRDLTEFKLKYNREFNAVIDAMIQQITDLEEKLTQRERDLLDNKTMATNDSQDNTKAGSPNLRAKVNDTEPNSEEDSGSIPVLVTKQPIKSDQTRKPTDSRPKTKIDDKKGQKKETKKDDKKGDKKHDKKDDKKDDKKKDPAKDKNKPWTNMNKWG